MSRPPIVEPTRRRPDPSPPTGLRAEAGAWYRGEPFDASPTLASIEDDEADAVARTMYSVDEGSFTNAPSWDDAAEELRRYHEARARWFLAVARRARQERFIK